MAGVSGSHDSESPSELSDPWRLRRCWAGGRRWPKRVVRGGGQGPTEHVQEKPLSIAMREIDAGLLTSEPFDPAAEVAVAVVEEDLT